MGCIITFETHTTCSICSHHSLWYKWHFFTSLHRMAKLCLLLGLFSCWPWIGLVEMDNIYIYIYFFENFCILIWHCNWSLSFNALLESLCCMLLHLKTSAFLHSALLRNKTPWCFGCETSPSILISDISICFSLIFLCKYSAMFRKNLSLLLSLLHFLF